MAKTLYKLKEAFSIVPPIDVEERSFYIQTESNQVVKLPLALSFIGLGHYPYQPWMDPVIYPNQYGLAPYEGEGGKKLFWYKRDYYTMYVPPHKDYFYLSLVENSNIKIKVEKEILTLDTRNTVLRQLEAADKLEGQLIKGVRIGEHMYEDPGTLIAFMINDDLMVCQ